MGLWMLEIPVFVGQAAFRCSCMRPSQPEVRSIHRTDPGLSAGVVVAGGAGWRLAKRAVRRGPRLPCCVSGGTAGRGRHHPDDSLAATARRRATISSTADTCFDDNEIVLPPGFVPGGR